MKSRVNAASARSKLAPLAYALSLTFAAGVGTPIKASATPAFDLIVMTTQVAAPAVVLPDDLRPRPSTGDAGYTPFDSEGRATYIVTLKDPAVGGYDGEIPGFERIPRIYAPGRPAHLDPRSPQARAYEAHLKGRQTAFIASLTRLLGRSVVADHEFQHALNAVVLRLLPEEADALQQHDDVLSVQRARRRQLRTYDTPAFIGATNLWSAPNFPAPAQPGPYKGEGMVIGVIDTGINYRSNSFKATGDDGYTPTNPLGAGTFLGRCVAGQADAGRCNSKLIGMYSVDGNNTGQDLLEHGSHTASTSGGNAVNNASYAGGAFNLSGIAPHANIISYDGCGDGPQGCSDPALLASINQAINDGIVDVINYSIGGPNAGPWLDNQDQAFKNAANAGIFVAAAAGNDGPGEVTTDSYAPWYTTVGATTPRGLPGFTLTATGWAGNATLVPGAAPAPSQAFNNLPLIESPNFANGSNDGCTAYPANYFRNPQNAGGTQGFAVLHLDQNASNCPSGTRKTNATNAGAAAVVYVDPEYINLGATGNVYSMLLADWTALKAAGVDVTQPGVGTGSISFPIGAGTRQSDILVGFSSRGPTQWGTLKPDLSAPGDTILAAVSPIAAADYALATTPNLYSTMSGTSMATPHVAGAAAIVRQARPGWTPHEVKSALMSTAVLPLTLSDGSTANPNQRGAGRIDPFLAAKAGFVLNESIANFNAANPATGGTPHTLNLASYYHANCIGVCNFPRTLKSAGTAATWSLAVSGLPAGSFNLSTASVVLGASGTQGFTLSVDSTAAGLTKGQWYYGNVTLTPSVGTLPTAHFPIAFRASTAKLGVTPNPIVKSVQTGTTTTQNLAISNAGNPTLNWSIPTTTLKGSIMNRPVGPNQNGLISHTIVTTATNTAIDSGSNANSYGADWFEIFANGTTLAELQMSGFGYDSVNQFYPPIDSFGTQFAFRVWGDTTNPNYTNAGLPNGRPGNTVGGDVNPLFQWPAAAGGGPVNAPGLSFKGDDVKLDLTAASVSSPSFNAGRYWLNFAPSIDRSATGASGLNFYQLLAEIPGKTPAGQQACPNVNGGPDCTKNWAATTAAGAQYTGYAMKVVVNAVCGAPWISYSATSGSLGSGGIADVNVTFNATSLLAGTYKAYVCVSGNGTSPEPSEEFIGGQDSFIVPVTLTVGAAVNDAPVFTSEPYNYSVAANAANGTGVGTLTSADVDAGQTRNYQILSGNTGSAFAINSGTGAITVVTPAAVTLANSPFNFRVRVTDVGNPTPNLSDEATVTITVASGANTPPTISDTLGQSTNEDVAEIVTFTINDVDSTLTCASSVSASSSNVALIPVASIVFTGTAPNCTATLTPASNQSGTSTVGFTVSDGTLTASDSFVQTVVAQGDAPSISDTANQSTNEDVVEIVTFTINDVDSTLTCASSVSASSSNVALIPVASIVFTGTAPNCTATLTPASNQSGTSTIGFTVSDGTLTASDSFVQTVVAQNDQPSITSASSANVLENTIAVQTVTATDPEGSTLTYSISGGTDMTRFSINASSGALGFVVAPNFEAPSDVGADNVYNLTVRASDGSLFIDQAVAVTVTDAAENSAPVLAVQSAVNVAENTTAVQTASANDADGGTLTFSLSGGADQARFSINAANAALSFVSAPNFEAPTDAGANNVYDVIVRVTDNGSLFDEEAVAVTVTNANETPTRIGSIAAQSSSEGSTITPLATAGNFSDPDSDTLSYSATGLPPGLSIDASSGQISGTPSFTSNVGSPHSTVVTATDPGNALVTHSFTWTVSNTNRAPSFTSSPVLSVSEDTAYSYTVTITDPDINDAHVLSAIVLPAWLSFNPGTGTCAGTPSNAAVGTHNVTLRVGDGTTQTDQVFTITVTNANDAPTVAAPIDDRSDAEGTSVNLNVSGNFADADAGQTLSFTTSSSLPAGVSLSAAGVIAGTIGFAAAGIYPVTVTANDGNGGTVADSFEWTVTNTNRVPTAVASIANRTDAEGAAVTQAMAANFSDVDGDFLQYSATGLPGGLGINAITGQIGGTLTLTSAGGYNVVVTATDASNASVTQAFNWTVTEVPQNQAPVVTDQGFLTSETAIIGTAVGSIVSSDEEGNSVSFTVTGGTGQALFNVAANGDMTVAAALSTGSYTLNVTGTDNGSPAANDTAVITISVVSGGLDDGSIFYSGFEGS